MSLYAAGGGLADVTEEAGVEAGAQTLVAGLLGSRHLLQALADRVLLCRLDSLLGWPPGVLLLASSFHRLPHMLPLQPPTLASMPCTHSRVVTCPCLCDAPCLAAWGKLIWLCGSVLLLPSRKCCGQAADTCA